MSTRAHMVANPAYSSQHVAQDRPIRSTAVPCPDCKAAVGEKCTTSTGGRANHKSRRRMAIRALNESYTAPDAGWIASVKPEARKDLRGRAGLTAAQMGDMFDVPDWVVRDWESGRRVPTGPKGAAYERWLRRALGQDVPEPSEVSL